MSKRAQQNQSAFNVGEKIGLKIAKERGPIHNLFFNARFKTLYKGAKSFQSVARSAARIGYAKGLDKATKVAQAKTLTTELTGGQDAKL